MALAEKLKINLFKLKLEFSDIVLKHDLQNTNVCPPQK